MAIAYPVAAGTATEILLDAIRVQHPNAPAKEAGTEAALKWLAARYPEILGPPACPPTTRAPAKWARPGSATARGGRRPTRALPPWATSSTRRTRPSAQGRARLFDFLFARQRSAPRSKRSFWTRASVSSIRASAGSLEPRVKSRATASRPAARRSATARAARSARRIARSAASTCEGEVRPRPRSTRRARSARALSAAWRRWRKSRARRSARRRSPMSSAARRPSPPAEHCTRVR